MSAQKLITEYLDLWTGAISSRSSSGRGNNSKIELAGIKALRDLILELALSGKLVGPHHGDESAHELPSHIKAEKSRLLAKGIIRTNKVPGDPISSPPHSIPGHWCWARLGDVTNYGTTDKAEPNQVANDTWVLELEDVEKETSKLLNKVRYKERQFKSSKNRFECGDVLYGKLRPYLDKVLVADEPGVCTTEIIPIRGHQGLLSEFLRLALKSPSFRRYANDSTHGMNLPRLGTDKARMAIIPIAPTAEQRRIVQKVDELMALCDRLEQQTSDQLEAHETLVDTLLGTLTQSENATDLADNWARLATHFDTLFTTEQNIDKLKQTILQLAVMGRLVEQTASDAPAQDLLDQVKSKRVSLYKEGVISKPKALPPISTDEHYMEIPAGWAWARFGETGCTRLGKMLDKAKNSGTERPYLRNTNVQWWRVDVDDVKTFKLESHELDEYRLQKGDLLICEGGEPGRCAVYSESEAEMYFQKAIHRHRTLGLCSPDYLKICLTVDAHNGRLSERFTGATIKHLPGDKLMTHLCPIPPKQEQCRIVGKVDELMTLCNQLKESLNQASETRCQLADAIVEGALH